MDHKWERSSLHAAFEPQDAVVGGYDSDGSVIYVGRAEYKGDLLPAKVIPKRKAAYVSWGGKEIVVSNYGILCGQNYKWILGANGEVPLNAVCTGTTKSGERLYIGRGHLEGSLAVGKIHLRHNSLFIPYGGREHILDLDSFEVLVFDMGYIWSEVVEDRIPPTAIIGGHDSDGANMFVGRSYHDDAGEYLPAKVIPGRGCAVSYNGREIIKDTYEVFTGEGYDWAYGTDGNIPPNAVLACSDSSVHERLYIGRGYWENSLTVGKVHPSHGCLYIPYGGSEVRLNEYEVLFRKN